VEIEQAIADLAEPPFEVITTLFRAMDTKRELGLNSLPAVRRPWHNGFSLRTR